MRIPGYAEIAPVLALMAVYHWAIYRPNLMPLWSIFVLGVLQDLLSGVPLGLYILVFLTVYGVVLSTPILCGAFIPTLLARLWYHGLLCRC